MLTSLALFRKCFHVLLVQYHIFRLAKQIIKAIFVHCAFLCLKALARLNIALQMLALFQKRLLTLVLDNTFHNFDVAAFITFETFVLIIGKCILLLLSTLLQLLLLAEFLIIAILFIIIIAMKHILKLQRVQYVLAMVATLSSELSHSLPNLKLAACPISHYLKDLYNYPTSTFIQATSIFIFNVHSCKTTQTASII